MNAHVAKSITFPLGTFGLKEEVEVFEGLVGLEGRASQSLLELFALTPFDFIVKNTQQKLRRMNVIFDALADALLKALEHTAQA
jgi:hypothetical protein